MSETTGTEERTSVEVLDSSPGIYSQGYTLDRLVKIGRTKLRIRIKRDSYDFQSFAVAEVFNATGTWTHLLDSPPSDWHARTPYKPASTEAVAGLLGSIADELTNRAYTFLET